MGPSQKLLWRIYAGALGAATTFAAQKLLAVGWRIITGNEPPTPSDPDTPTVQAYSWVVASAIGVGVTELVTQRLAARHWSNEMGSDAPEPRKVRLTFRYF
jgi:hypothetical protein